MMYQQAMYQGAAQQAALMQQQQQQVQQQQPGMVQQAQQPQQAQAQAQQTGAMQQQGQAGVMQPVAMMPGARRGRCRPLPRARPSPGRDAPPHATAGAEAPPRRLPAAGLGMAVPSMAPLAGMAQQLVMPSDAGLMMQQAVAGGMAMGLHMKQPMGGALELPADAGAAAAAEGAAAAAGGMTMPNGFWVSPSMLDASRDSQLRPPAA